MNNFAPVSVGGSLRPVEVDGHLLIVQPTEFIPQMTTSMGTSDAIRVDVHDLTDQETYTSVLWFSKVLVSSLRHLIGQQVLARMGKGESKNNQSAPWILIDASDDPDAVTAANTYLAAVAKTRSKPDNTDQAVRNVKSAIPGSAVVA